MKLGYNYPRVPSITEKHFVFYVLFLLFVSHVPNLPYFFPSSPTPHSLTSSFLARFILDGGCRQ
jgi:hypothetical protein